MSKVKQVLVASIIFVIALLAYVGIVRAYNYGDEIKINYSKYRDDPNLFCVEHNQSLHKEDVTYKVISEVKIVGNQSTDQDGKTITNQANAVLAYILSSSTEEGQSKQSGSVQNALWKYMYTWMSEVGKNHNGLYLDFVNNKQGNDVGDSLLQDAKNYALDLENIATEITDNTNRNAISIQSDGNTIKIGPFNWSFSGTLSEVIVKDQNGNAINGVTFSSYRGLTANTFGVDGIKSGTDFYISIPSGSGISSISSIYAKGSKDVKGVTIWFLEAQGDAKWQNLIAREPTEGQLEYETPFDYNIPLLGHLRVIKVNEDNHEIRLQGVGFKIQNKQTGLYVHQDANGKITYVNQNQATEFVTDSNGEILVKNLIVGTYVAYETKNPNYGYEMITNGVEQTVVVDKTTDFVIGNKQIYVKLSGYVWLDKVNGKGSYRNNLYKTDSSDYQDTEDILLEGVIVRLMDRRTGEVVTNSNGQPFYATTKEIVIGDNILRYYQFVDVEIDNLANYYIEFEYDGLTYTNVTPHIDADTGSKAAENPTVREEFNKGFSRIEGASLTTGVALDENGNVAHELSYTRDTEQHTSTLINEGLPVGQFPITATTDETGYMIKDQFEYGMEEIPYINLGLYEREQPDLRLIKDMEDVKLEINGYNHIYKYAQRYANLEAQDNGDYGDSGFNIGVEFGSEYFEHEYTRPIYRADFEYVNEEDPSRELKVYLTYKLRFVNQSTNLTSQVNNIVDYFDSRYTIVAVGTGLDENSMITGNLEYDEPQRYNDEYNKTTIYTNSRIEAQKYNEIYVQFALTREAVIEILNNRETLNNVAEITSYSTFDANGAIYAGIDIDSNPGNAIPNDESTLEDDTEWSPPLKLEVADARELTGKVFLDSTTGELLTGQIRQGSGQYEEGEKGIQNVEVTLTEITGTGLTYNATTDENGDFYISNFIPGDYTLTYTWGDETYTVQNYKGTVYNKDRYNENIANKEWYKTDVSTRWTDALDNYNQDQEAPKGSRLQIDAEANTITNSTTFTRTKMDSTTPTMGIGVEYETTYTASSGDKYVYRIENIDFGIVERPRQDISLNKKVSAMKLTLPNGQVLVDFTVTDDGKLEGQTTGVIYLPPAETTVPRNGLLRLELDSELMQGSTLQITYEIKADNISELDYISEDFYKYGIEGQESEKVTITPTGIVDYLDTDWTFDQTINPDWEVVDKNDSRLDLAQTVRESQTIDNRTILYTEALATPLKPTESSRVELYVSKLLAASEDIELDNETEIVRVDKPYGPDISSTPGNYEPGTGPKIEKDDDMPVTIIITPNTGANLDFILPIAVTVTAFVIVGVGIVFIRKKVLNK